jgi:hypothetical protein
MRAWNLPRLDDLFSLGGFLLFYLAKEYHACSLNAGATHNAFCVLWSVFNLL